MIFCSRTRWTQGVLFLAVLTLLFILPSFIKEYSMKPSRYQFKEKNKEEKSQEILQNATLHSHSMEKPLRAPDKEMTSVRTGALGLKNQGSVAARGEEEEKRKDQSQVEPAAKTPVPESRGKILTTTRAVLTKQRKRPKATAAVPAKEKATQVNPPLASFPRPTTKKRQRLKASDFKSEPRWDFEEEYNLDVGGPADGSRKTAGTQPHVASLTFLTPAQEGNMENLFVNIHRTGSLSQQYSGHTTCVLRLAKTCPDSVKIRASKSPWLKNIFLPNLTLFLDGAHFTQSEWDRLEHFAPPFGFMELNQSLVQKVVTRFPPVPQQQLLLASLPSGSSRCITCAVVGNGGILNDSHVGQEIDSHDYVFRLSGAVIKGYEQDVGTRTSFYGFTAFSLVQSILILGSRGFQHVPLGKDVRYLHFLEGTRDYEWLEAMFLNQTMAKTKLHWFRHRPQEAFRDALDMDRYLLLHPDFIRYMKNRFLRSKTLNTAHWRIYRPTTGALLLLTALHLCDQVSAYGFITQGHERFSDHYYDKTWKRLIFYTNHDFRLEKAVWKRLHDEGLIRLYQRPENPKEKN